MWINRFAVAAICGATCFSFLDRATAEVVVEQGRADVRPWSGPWWPYREGGILRPLKKYDRTTGRKAYDWEARRTTADSSTPAWFGYCHAWAASSILESEPRRPRNIVGRAGDRQHFSVGDQKALLAACHTRDLANVYGDRFGDKRGADDRDDLAPDVLWRLLRLYLGRMHVPLVLDIESGPEVWNFPVYAYRLEHEPAGNQGGHRARLVLWMADNDVTEHFVGTRVRKESYEFVFRMRSGVIVANSARWTGESRQNHPDFAWFPIQARTENPYIDADIVRGLIEKSGRKPKERQRRPIIAARPRPRLRTDNVVSTSELAGLLSSSTSSSSTGEVDITIDRFDGGHYRVGEPIGIRVSSRQAGFLQLFHIRPNGELTLLFPRPGQDNRIDVLVSRSLPVEGEAVRFVAAAPRGVHRIVALVTQRRVELTGLLPRATQAGNLFRWHPTEHRRMRERLRRADHKPLPAAAVKRLQLVVGRWAVDEAAFYVAPKRLGKNQKPNEKRAKAGAASNTSS